MDFQTISPEKLLKPQNPNALKFYMKTLVGKAPNIHKIPTLKSRMTKNVTKFTCDGEKKKKKKLLTIFIFMLFQ